jgi:hypothetical protein
MYVRVDDQCRDAIVEISDRTGLSQSAVIHLLCRRALGMPGISLDHVIAEIPKPWPKVMGVRHGGAGDSAG